jgi:hypothetical protein
MAGDAAFGLTCAPLIKLAFGSKLRTLPDLLTCRCIDQAASTSSAFFSTASWNWPAKSCPISKIIAADSLSCVVTPQSPMPSSQLDFTNFFEVTQPYGPSTTRCLKSGTCSAPSLTTQAVALVNSVSPAYDAKLRGTNWEAGAIIDSGDRFWWTPKYLWRMQSGDEPLIEDVAGRMESIAQAAENLLTTATNTECSGTIRRGRGAHRGTKNVGGDAIC